MLNIIKVLLFVLVNIAGWFSIQIIALISIKYGTFPTLPAIDMEILKWWYFNVGVLIWLASALASIGYFFIDRELKNWLLLAPMYVTSLYCIAILVYFKFMYTIY